MFFDVVIIFKISLVSYTLISVNSFIFLPINEQLFLDLKKIVGALASQVLTYIYILSVCKQRLSFIYFKILEVSSNKIS